MKEKNRPKTSRKPQKNEKNLKLFEIEQRLINEGIISIKRLTNKSDENNKLINIQRKTFKNKILNKNNQKNNIQTIHSTSNNSSNNMNNINLNIIQNLQKNPKQKRSLKMYKKSNSVNLNKNMNCYYKNPITETISNYNTNTCNNFLHSKTLSKNKIEDNIVDKKEKHFNYAKWNKISINTIFDKDDSSINLKTKYNKTITNINRFHKNKNRSPDIIQTDYNEAKKVYRHKTIDNIRSNDNINIKRNISNLLEKISSPNRINKDKFLSNKKLIVKIKNKQKKKKIKNSYNTKSFQKKNSSDFLTSISAYNSINVNKQFNKNNTCKTLNKDLKINEIIIKSDCDKNQNKYQSTNYISDSKANEDTESTLNKQNTLDAFRSLYNNDAKNNNIGNKTNTSSIFRKKISGCMNIRITKKNNNIDNYYFKVFKGNNYNINNSNNRNLFEIEKENKNEINDKCYNNFRENNWYKLEYDNLEKICLNQEKIITDLLNNVQKLNYQISDKDQHINKLSNQLYSIKSDLLNTFHKNN